jgi:glycosyltransferase involved in cell wall biosynthesis
VCSPISGAQSAARMFLDHLIGQFAEDVKFYVITDRELNLCGDFPIRPYFYSPYNIPNIPGLNFLWENFLATRRIQQVCEKIKPDLVHIHGYSGFYPSPPDNYPVLFTFQDFPPTRIYDDFSTGPSKLLEFIWYDISRVIRLKRLESSCYFHAVSSEIQDFLKAKGIESNRIFLVPNGVRMEGTPRALGNDMKETIRRKIGLSPVDKMILMVGQITFRKGIHRVLKALDYLPHNYHLVLDGKPLPFIGNQYLKAILTSKHKKRIHFLGYSPQSLVKALFQIADCYISVSFSEACQLTILEALYFGSPVIVSDVGAASDIIEANDTNYLVKNPEDSKTLASIIEKACASTKIERNFQGFQWKEIAKSMKDIYEKIISQSLHD